MDIVSKFTIASEDGIRNLFMLKETQIREMYKGSVEEAALNAYIKQQLDERATINDLNNLSTQMMTVFLKDVPVGYVIIRQSVNPKILAEQKVIHYSSFYIMSEYNNTETRTSLWNKCLSVTRKYDAMWIEVLQTDPLIPFLESCGFMVHEQSEMKPFGKASHIMIRPKIED